MVDGSLLHDIQLGLNYALSASALLFCAVGVSLGMFVGVLPGIGTMSAVAILMPLTFYLDPATAIAMLAGIYYGAAYGGSTASILLNLPGTANTAVTCLDGYPMAQQGRAGIALFMTTIASFVGSIIGLAMLGMFAPPLARLSQSFGSQEYFALMLMGLIAASVVTSENPFRALSMVAIGLALGLVGLDVTSGSQRFTFGMLPLYGGLPLVAVALGLFGMPEVIRNAGRRRANDRPIGTVTLRSMLPTRDDWGRSVPAMLRGTGIGAFFGALPGTGGLIATFMSYAVEKRISKEPGRFGKGAIEGVASPEAANNSAIQTAFIPTLTLGVPGDAVMALLLGVLMIHNVTPGIGLVEGNPTMFWGLIFTFLVGNLFLLILNIPLIGIWVRILTIPYSLLFPSIVVFVCIGVYSIGYQVADLYIVIAFTLAGYVLSLLRFEPAPLIMGLILGPMMEENFRRSMVLSRGDAMTFMERPLSGSFMGICAVLLLWLAISEIRRARAGKLKERLASGAS